MIKEKLKLLPTSPGCYLMKNKNNEIIYVGKAKNLKNRVSSYFNGSHTGKTGVLVSNIVDFEYIVTKSEVEALILELNLIKQYDPKYNVLLRDDKTYPYIELTDEKYPRLLVVRNPLHKKNKSKLFGPYPNVYAAKKTVNMLNRIYPLRKCSTLSNKVCLYFHIEECLGYCNNNVNKNVINNMVSDITKFLKGNNNILIKKIEKEMYEAAANLNYEKAGEMKVLLDDIKITLKNQYINLNDNIDRDIFGFYIDKGYISIQVFHLRGGKLVERDAYIYPTVDDVNDELINFICSFYDNNNLKPKEILVPNNIDILLLEEVLAVKVLNPKKGKKKNMLDLTNQNAKLSLELKFDMLEKNENRTNVANKELGKVLGIEKLSRIEAFDNSHLFGSFSVSGMVVFIDGKKVKNEYRKYKITSDYNDDYHLMKEVIYRRYFRVLRDNLVRPDLMIVDGGKAQVKAAVEVLDSLKMKIPVCGLKKNDKHQTNELLYNNNVININKDSNLFHFLTRIQDEVHNYTISYHKKIRSKGALESILDNINGIGEKRKKVLLKKFKSLNEIINAPEEELVKFLPIKVVKELKEYFDKK